MIKKEMIQKIKSEIDLKSYIESIGHTFKKAGKSYLCRCPFKSHEDSTPSFSVTPDKNLFHCFGCGIGGDIFTFVMHYDQVAFVESVKRLEKEIFNQKGAR